eukprot:SAG31_NODE_3328_length_4401_cov_4.831939_1_plen_138_part_00
MRSSTESSIGLQPLLKSSPPRWSQIHGLLKLLFPNPAAPSVLNFDNVAVLSTLLSTRCMPSESETILNKNRKSDEFSQTDGQTDPSEAGGFWRANDEQIKTYAEEAKLIRLPVKVWLWLSALLDDRGVVVGLSRSSE